MFKIKLILNLSILLFIVITLTSCSGKLNPQLPIHTKAYIEQFELRRKLGFSELPKGNTWQGKWLFTVKNKECLLHAGTMAFETTVDNNGMNSSGKSLDPKKLSPDQIVYAGFTSLYLDQNNKPSGFDIITNSNNFRTQFKDLKINGNKLSWIFETPNSDGFSAGRFTNIAQYNPKTDTLAGQTKVESLLDVIYNPKTKKIQPVKPPQFINTCNYAWVATRLDDKDFQRYTVTGKYFPEIPTRILSTDIKHPETLKQLK